MRGEFSDISAIYNITDAHRKHMHLSIIEIIANLCKGVGNICKPLISMLTEYKYI